MSKKSNNINFSEIFLNIDVEVSNILKICNNFTSVKLLKSEELEILNNHLFELIAQNNVEELSEQNIQQLRSCLELLLHILSSTADADIKLKFVNILKYINSDELLTEEPKLINLVSKINEHWMVKMQCQEEIQGMEYLTLKYLLNQTTSERPLVSDIQRLSSIRKVITAVPFDKTVPSLRPLLIKLAQKLPVLSSEHGQRFLAQALVLSQKIMMEIHKTIMLELNSCNKKKAGDYGKIYVFAWHAASEDMKKILVKTCFQHLMETIMKEQRTTLELNKNSKNILEVLEVWNSERKKKNPDFITMITNAYQPILWKYLQSGFNVHRCNATDVFFKAFPLQRSGDNALDAETLFSKQYDAMLSSLTDDCHIIRVIGIREVCNILSLYWNSFNPSQIQCLLSVITKQNASDASTAEVRRMVYVGFQSLVKSPLSREYVKQILPNLADNIHDVNQKVRIAFFQLLICVKDLKDPNFKYSDCVSMFNIQYRLAEDNIAVGQWIVKLLMRNYYHPEMPVVEWTKRFIYLIKTYKHSYRNFFFYSSKSLPFVNACTIIHEILTQIGAFVISKFTVEKENNETLAEKSREKRKGNKKVPLSELNGSQEASASGGSTASKKCAFDDPEVVSGLFDVVTILWVLHDAKLTEPENEEIRLKLYDTYIKYAQPFINYYKDSSLFLGVITLSGNIPASLLRNNNITLPGYCLKMLKSINIDRSKEENEKLISILTALVKWGRGNEILEQISLWLDAAFETKDMNETILPRRRVKISESIQPNSLVAINILDSLLKIEYVKLSILKKNYQELFYLWKFMSRIRKLIETRIEQGEPFEEDLVSDEFLNRCFERYVKLIPLLKEDEKVNEEKESQNVNETSEVFVNRQKEMESVIEWGENFLFPLLQSENLEEADVRLIAKTLEDILYVADNMIVVHIVNNLFHFKIAHFVLKLLRTRCGVYFVKAASRVTVSLSFSAKLLFKVKDDLQIFSTVIPSLLSHILDVLTTENLQNNQINKLEKDLPTVKTCLEKILMTYQDNLSSTSNLKENVRLLRVVISFFVDCLINKISQEIPRKDSTIPIYSTASQLPPVASALFVLFHNKKTWTPLFIHVITTKLKEFNAKDTVSCILLLNLYAVSDKKVNDAGLKKALTSASSNLNKLKESVGKRNIPLDDFFTTESETETVTKKTWPSNAATKGTWTKLDPIADVEENGSVERSSHDSLEKEESLGDKTEVTRSFLCEGNNMEMDFINCGFEILKNIENLKEKDSMEVDES